MANFSLFTFLIVLTFFVGGVEASSMESLRAYLPDGLRFSLSVVTFGIIGTTIVSDFIVKMLFSGQEPEEFVRDVSDIIAPVQTALEQYTPDLKIHTCLDPRCAYIARLYELERSDTSDYGFCVRSKTRLASPSGTYLHGTGAIRDPVSTSRTLCSAFPHFDGIAPVTKSISCVVFKWNNHWTRLLHNLAPRLTRGLGLVTVEPLDPVLLHKIGGIKFETSAKPWAMLDRSRSLNARGSRFKTHGELLHLNVIQYYRYCAGLTFPDFTPGEYNGPVYEIRKSDIVAKDGEMFVIQLWKTPREEEDLASPPESELDKSGAAAPPAAVSLTPVLKKGKAEKEDKSDNKVPEQGKSDVLNEELVHAKPLLLPSPNEATVEKLPSFGLTVDSFKGLETEERDLFKETPPPALGRVELVKEKTEVPDGGPRKVVYSNVFGMPLSVFDNTRKNEKLAVGSRLDVPVPVGSFDLPSFGDDERPPGKMVPVRELLLSGKFPWSVVGNLPFIGRIPTIDDRSWIPEKLSGLKPHQKKRILEVLQMIDSTGTYQWSAKENVVKYFPKGDEVLAKSKPRIITFIPTVAWLRMVLLLEKFLTFFKRGDHWCTTISWKNRELDIYWASGMTQDQLSRALTRASDLFHSEQREAIFVCGDDNLDCRFTSDASAYDSTQGEKFFELQKMLFASVFQNEDRDKVMKTLDDAFTYHSGVRYSKFGTWRANEISLPTGGPHTLVFNTLGIIIYRLSLHYLNTFKHDVLGEKDAFEDPDNYAEAAEVLGLKMKVQPNPDIGGRCLAGAEFLKGIAVSVDNSLEWVPAPGGIAKLSKMILEPGKPTPSGRILALRTTEVANGFVGYPLDPLRDAHFRVWSSSTQGKAERGWVNIEERKKSLTMGDRDVFLKKTRAFWEELFEQRYGIDAVTLKKMRAQILENGKNFAYFKGRAWTSLVTTDYRGEPAPD